MATARVVPSLDLGVVDHQSAEWHVPSSLVGLATSTSEKSGLLRVVDTTVYPSGYVGAGLSCRGVDSIPIHAARLGCVYISEEPDEFSIWCS